MKFSIRLEAMLKEHIKREEIKPTERLFKTKPRTYAKNLRVSRNALAKKRKDQDIRTIRLYGF